MALETSPAVPCAPCSTAHYRPSFWERYRSFFLSFNVLVTVVNALLLVAGFVASWAFHATLAADILWIASALIGGSPIFVLAARGIVKGDLTAGVMVSVAMIAAVLIGEYSAAALVAFMMMFGEMLENFTMARANNALKELARLIPADVTLLCDGRELVVPVEQIHIGDVLLVRNGERIPVDGAVTAGQAAVDQATITGESVPVDKQAGDTVFAGTINTAGTLQIQAQKIGRDTTLGTIVKLVEEAQKTQAPVQRVANKYAQILVPITFAIAILVYLLTGQLVRSVTVLVVVCPCALVLATPTALAAAIGNAARHNAIVKSGTGMEALGKVQVIAFDKTGTLTVGQPRVAEVVALDGTDANAVLTYAASAEKFSEHPLGRAIVEAAIAASLPLTEPHDAEVLTGYGVRARSDGRQVLVGNRALLNSAAIPITPEHDARIAGLEAAGYTVVPVALDRQMVGLIALADTIRPEAIEAVRALKMAGLDKTVLISGDNAATVAAVAAQLGVDEYHAQVLPQQKLDLIRQLQVGGRQVAYVGDGVNDAPALATANVGIAMGAAGTDVAIETAHIALMTDDMHQLPHLLRLSRETLRTIRLSVAFSMSMNLLSLTLSTFGIIGPAVGAMMHELSALPVLAYSARLVSYSYRPRS
ncbi:MAG: cation-translocating P-type ATPase [Chloroflexi bacterium]|nr:cation-translocating P-type ATPase [Chloroflexota bacterium]